MFDTMQQTAMKTVFIATIAFLACLGRAEDSKPLAGCRISVSDFTPLTVAELASIQEACGASSGSSAVGGIPSESCPTCICAVFTAITASLQRKGTTTPTAANPNLQALTRGMCGETVAVALQMQLGRLFDAAWGQLASCLDVQASKVSATSGSCGSAAAAPAARKRSLLQVPAGLNTTVAGAQNAAETVSGRFNNLTTDLNQLGQNSSLDAVSRSGSANPGEYVNAFVNDTRGALGAIGNVFNAAEQYSVSKGAWAMMAAAVFVLAAPLL